MYAIAPVSSLGAPTAPIRSVTKHRRPQSQPRLTSTAMKNETQEMLALGYHETEQGTPPVPLIPARSAMRSRSNSTSAANATTMMALALSPPPPVPALPATLKKKKQIRTMTTTAARPVPRQSDVPPVPPLPLSAPPRPPRPADADCLLSSSAPDISYMTAFDRCPPPVPPIPAGLFAKMPRTAPRRGHAYSNSTSSTGSIAGNSSDSSGAVSIATPRHSEDSLEFRHIALSSSSSATAIPRNSSHKKSSSYSQPTDIPSMSVWEESSDEDESSYTHERSASRKFRKGGLSLMSRSGHKHSNSRDATTNTSHPTASVKPVVPEGVGRGSLDEFRRRGAIIPAPGPTSVPGLSDGNESSNPPSAGDRTPTDLDEIFSKRFGRNFTTKAPPPKPAHPDDELIVLMQSLKTPKRRESAARIRPNKNKTNSEGKSLSLTLPPITTTKEPLFAAGSLGAFMIH